MINSNPNSVQVTSLALGRAGEVESPVRNTFKALMGELVKRPLKPLGVQQFAGPAKRSLALQVYSDITPIN